MNMKKTDFYFNGTYYENYASYAQAVATHCRESKCSFYYGKLVGCMFGEIMGDNPRDCKCTKEMWGH